MERKKKKTKQIHFTIPKPRRSHYNDDFRDFDDEFRPALNKLFFAKVRCSDTADDLSQCSLIKFWTWKQGRVRRGLDFTWSGADAALAMSCSMVFADHINESKRAMENLFTSDDLTEFDVPDNGLSDPYRTLVGERTSDAICKFASISGKDGGFFLDAILNGLSHRELAKKYKKTEGSSGTDLCRLKKEFLDYMKVYGALPEEEGVYVKI